MSTKTRTKTTRLTFPEDEIIRQLKEDIAGGKHWYIALLESIGRWSKAEEVVDGQVYKYLINGNAFDWLFLAERLCRAVNNLLPDDEMEALLFKGKAPLDFDTEEFKKLIGNQKYEQHLNYSYSITTEEALIQAVEDEVRKERSALGKNNEQDITDEAYQRIYGIVQYELFKLFKREKSYRYSRSINLTQLKEFIYWLFKFRLKHCEKERIGSDTKKALKWLRRNTNSKSIWMLR
jgi:hypothetical protein